MTSLHTSRHTHRPEASRDEAFGGPVSRRQNRAAHGNITRVDTCRCGATRHTNRNQGHIERGEWVESDAR